VARRFVFSAVYEKTALLPWYPDAVAAVHPRYFPPNRLLTTIIWLLFDRDHHFIQMPFVRNIRAFALKLIRVLLSELLTPFPNRFVGHFDAPIQHHFLDIPVAQWKGVIQPNTMANNFGRKSMTGIHEQEVANKVEPYGYSTARLS
jgi:hypothetical protein